MAWVQSFRISCKYPGSMMYVEINDRKYELGRNATVKDALQLLKINEESLAVAVNYTVVPKRAWPDYALAEGDVVMLVAATQGG